MPVTVPIQLNTWSQKAAGDLVIFNVGYEKRSLHQLCATLVAAGVEVLLDVRERPWSMRPEFRRERLRKELDASGIGYVHCKAAGNPYRPKPGEVKSFDDCMRDYERHIRASPDVVEEMSGLLRGRRAAVFCYEARRDRCHRSVLLDAIERIAGPLTVVDL
ncbi:MAG: DUF488 domain-containing protein [Deltaproteobacteria bacterium]|nr:DUF488 domain-containing protein [Deltaproteobacteria bacterium]